MENLKILKVENLKFNLQQFKNKKICAMIKANAYGHGLAEIVKLVADEVDFFGVVNVSEGIAVRKFTDKPILICSKVQDLKACKRYELDVMVESESDIKKCLAVGLENSMHLKINCGMNRYGSKSTLNLKIINKILEEKQIQLKTIYTHFPRTESKRQTKQCHREFLKLRNLISQKTEICFGGSGIYDFPFAFDVLRLGIGLYGYGNKELKPVMKICSYVSKVFYAKRGEYIGYGKKYKVAHQGPYALIPVGYGDGLHRILGGRFKVRIGQKTYKAVGNICMDAFFVKVDEIVKVGDKVEVMYDAAYLAKKAKTISYEILTSFSNFRGKTKLE